MVLNCENEDGPPADRTELKAEVTTLQETALKEYLLVSVEKEMDTHCGYCSDATDFTTKMSKSKCVFRGIPSSMKLNSDEVVTSYISSRLNLEPELCTLGSGYCGCFTRYRVRSYKFRKEIECSPTRRRR